MRTTRYETRKSYLMFFAVMYYFASTMGGLCLTYSHENAGTLVMLSSLILPFVILWVYYRTPQIMEEYTARRESG